MVASNLPCDDDSGLWQYAEAVVDAIGDRAELVVAAQSFAGLVRERLGIVPDEIDAGHCVALSRPKELAERLDAYRASQIAP